MIEKIGYFLIAIILSIQLSYIQIRIFNTYNLQNELIYLTKQDNNNLLLNIDKIIEKNFSELKLNFQKSFSSQKIFNNIDSVHIIKYEAIQSFFKILKFKELLDKEIFTREVLLEFINFASSLENHNLKIDVYNLKNKDIESFEKIQKLFQESFHKLYYKEMNFFDKIKSKIVLLINKQTYPWNVIFKINELLSKRHWSAALELSKKELLTYMEFSELIQKLETIVLIKESIETLYESLYQNARNML